MFAGVTDALRLFIESSTPRASLALLRGSTVVFHESFASDRSHNARLFSPLTAALSQLAKDERLAGVVIGTGPGSYSGTRVGIAAGQGVAMVHGCPAVGLTSLLAVVKGPALAVGDARRGSAWRLKVRYESPGDDPELCDVGVLEGEIRDALAEGTPVISLEAAGKIGLPADLVASVSVEQPDALGLASAWGQLAAEVKADLEKSPPQPVYLRPPHVTMAKSGHPLLRK